MTRCPSRLMVGEHLPDRAGSTASSSPRRSRCADGVKGLNHKLIPIFSDVIAPDPEMAALIDQIARPSRRS
jgi:sulfur-oxidizing protein SoxB